jgi:threonine synthase
MPPVRMRNAETLATSIGANQGTVQGLEVLRRCHGHAVTVTDDELVQWVVKLARTEGIWAEPAAAAPFAAIASLRLWGVIAPDALTVALVTAGGLKDARVIDAALPAPPLVTGGLDELLQALRQTYGYGHA